MHYEVVEYSDCYWVRRVGANTPVLYFEGVTAREEYLAYRAAMFLSRGQTLRESGNSERAVKQVGLVRELPGVCWWNGGVG